MNISGYGFEGPFAYTFQLKDHSGVYVVLDKNHNVLDVGESSAVKTRMESHDRKSCWKRFGEFSFFVYYISSEIKRKQIEEGIRRRYSPPCGEK